MKNLKTLFALILGLIIMGNTFAQGKLVTYQDGNTTLEGYFAKAKTGAPGVVIIHQWMGLSDHEKNSASKNPSFDLIMLCLAL